MPDRNGCSFGNAWLVVPSHFIPLASPRMVALGLKWMWNPESPFYIRPRFDPQLFEWYTPLRPGGRRFELPFAEVLAEGRRAFPRTSRQAQYTLRLSHRKRMQANVAGNLAERRQHPEAILIKASPRPLDLNRPQAFWGFPGPQPNGAAPQGPSLIPP